MASKKVSLPGSDRHPAGTRVGEVPKDEVIDVSVILKPKAHRDMPSTGGPVVSREEFSERYGADPARQLNNVKRFRSASTTWR